MKQRKITLFILIAIFSFMMLYGCAQTAGSEHQVTILTGGFATVHVSKSTAKQGEIITLSYEKNSSIRFKSWWVTEQHTGREVIVTNNQFVMPDDDVYVYCDVEFLGLNW